MLLAIIAALTLTRAEPVATIEIRTVGTDGAPIEWILFDHAGGALEMGSTPATLSRAMVKDGEVFCAAAAERQLDVRVVVQSNGTRVSGVAHCVKVKSDGAQVTVEEVTDPRN